MGKVVSLEQAKLRVLKRYVSFVRKKGFHPDRPELAKMGADKDRILRYFGSLSAMRAAARQYDPQTFENIVDESLFTRKALLQLKKEASRYRRFLITTAVVGKKVHKGFLESIKTFCREQNAMLLVLPCADPASIGGWHMDPILKDAAIVFDDISLNDNLFISAIKLSAKHIDPVTGLGRIGQRNGSFIYASPKQRLKMTPTSNTKLPHAMMTTGALTESKYSTTRYMSERTAYIADTDHVLGAIVVEIRDSKQFHYRQVQADKNGHFVDLGRLYGGDAVTTMRPEALVLGDWHSGETDMTAAEAFVFGSTSVCAVTRPRTLVVHDGFNGRSISHHEAHNRILLAQRSRDNHLDLQSELKEYAVSLDSLASVDGVEKVVIVQSNHDEFLHRYLREGRYEEDPKNFILGIKLAAAMVDGSPNPVRAGVESSGLASAGKLRWLSRDEDYKVANIELGAHGDKGANGARGSLRAMENAYANSVSGHAHTPEILRGAWQVGTCSKLKLDYNQGPSSWMHSSCLVYPNGARQLINVIGGEWRLED